MHTLVSHTSCMVVSMKSTIANFMIIVSHINYYWIFHSIVLCKEAIAANISILYIIIIMAVSHMHEILLKYELVYISASAATNNTGNKTN